MVVAAERLGEFGALGALVAVEGLTALAGGFGVPAGSANNATGGAGDSAAEAGAVPKAGVTSTVDVLLKRVSSHALDDRVGFVCLDDSKISMGVPNGRSRAILVIVPLSTRTQP